MPLKDRVFKIASYIFMIFMFVIIVISFGMPDFIGSSAGSSRLNLAKVGSENVTRREVGQIRNQLMQQYGNEMGEALKSFLETQALERAIYRKVFEQLLEDHKLSPTGKAANRILGKAYKENFPEYLNNGKFNFKELEKYFQARGYSIAQFNSSILADFSIREGQKLLETSSFASDFEIVDQMRFNETKLSFEVVIINNSDKEKMLKKELKISEADIQARFKKDYLSKDKNDKLTDIKREAIEKDLVNERKGTMENMWFKALDQEAQSLNLPVFAAKHGLKVYSWKNIKFDKSFEEQKVSNAPNMAFLDTNNSFLLSLFNSKIGMTQPAIQDAENIIFFRVTERKISDIPKISDLAKDKNQLETILKNQNDRQSIVDKIKEKRFQEAFTLTMEAFKKTLRIVRYTENDSKS